MGAPDGVVSVELRLLTEKASASRDKWVKETKDKNVPGPMGKTDMPRPRRIIDEGTLQTIQRPLLPKMDSLRFQRPFLQPGIQAGGLGTPPPDFVDKKETPKAQVVTLSSMIMKWFNKALTDPQQTFVKVAAGLAAMRVSVGLVSWGVRMAIAPLSR